MVNSLNLQFMDTKRMLGLLKWKPFKKQPGHFCFILVFTLYIPLLSLQCLYWKEFQF